MIDWGKTEVLTVKRGGGTCGISVKGVKVEELKIMEYICQGAFFNE